MSTGCRGSRTEADIRPFHRLLLVAYFIEVGLALAVIPWTRFWDRNLAVDAVPFLATLLNDSFVRGAVTGLGLVNLWAGFTDLAALLGAGARGSSVRRLSTMTVATPANLTGRAERVRADPWHVADEPERRMFD